MNCSLYRGILLAAQSRLDSLSSGFRGRRARLETDDIVTGLLIFSGIALAVWGLSLFLRLQERRRGYPRPLRLFLSLCRAHRLRPSEWWLLWRVARAQRLRDPARLFLEPERLQPADLGQRLAARADQLAQIRDRLFAQLDQQPQDQGSQAPEMPEEQPVGSGSY